VTDDAPPPSRRGVAGLVGALDAGVYRVEGALVTIISLVMTFTVFLDIVFRAFATGESQLAAKLVTVMGWFGASDPQSMYPTLRDYVTPAVLVITTFFTGWAVFVATRRRQRRPRPVHLGVAAGALAVGGAWAFTRFVVQVPSKWVCASLLLAGCLAYLVVSARRKAWLGVGIAAVVGGVGAWFCQYLPPQYIWSQELSLILLAWLAFLGASMATRAGKHIQVDALSRIIPKALQPWSRALGLAATMLFCAYITYLSYEHVFGPRGDYGSGEIRPATRIPAWTIIMAALVSFGLMTLRFLGLALDALIHPRAPEREISH
jgi:TRAP-type C4-dicarboxylate transport system permease small subunit